MDWQRHSRTIGLRTSLDNYISRESLTSDFFEYILTNDLEKISAANHLCKNVQIFPFSNRQKLCNNNERCIFHNSYVKFHIPFHHLSRIYKNFSNPTLFSNNFDQFFQSELYTHTWHPFNPLKNITNNKKQSHLCTLSRHRSLLSSATATFPYYTDIRGNKNNDIKLKPVC